MENDSLLQDRAKARHHNTKNIIDGFFRISRKNQLFYLKSFMKIRELLETEMSDLLKSKGLNEVEIAAMLNRITSRGQFIIAMEECFTMETKSEVERLKKKA